MKKLILPGAGLAAAMGCQALPPSYGESITGYKAEVKADNPALVNANFLGDIAGSKAVRKGDHIVDAAIHDANLAESRREVVGSSGGLRFASPTIYGTVRGDVTIVVQRGAIRGSVTSVNR